LEVIRARHNAQILPVATEKRVLRRNMADEVAAFADQWINGSRMRRGVSHAYPRFR